MKTLLLGLTFILATSACRTAPDYYRPLPPDAPALLPLDKDEKHPDFAPQWESREAIFAALDKSITWTKKESAKQFFPIEGVTHARALKSLERFRELLVTSKDSKEFARRLDKEFVVYKSAGWNGKGGGVLFTGYCTPILDGQLKEDATYRYPLYALPPDLVKNSTGEILGQQTENGLQPYPTRKAIEASALLENKNLELVWLKDPIDAYLAHVNGSAFIKLAGDPSGEMRRLGYAGNNGRAYTSLGDELVKDKQLKKDEVSLASNRRWAKEHPSEVDGYLHRNDRYVFFTRITGNPCGSLNVPVTAERSLATDKRLFPRGALVYVDARLNSSSNRGTDLHQFMFDQDTGSAIRTAGRADVYLGIGPQAESQAGTTRAEGQLYYVFLKE